MRRSGMPAMIAATSLLLASARMFAADAPVLDDAAMADLQKMGAYLRSLKAFSVDAVTSDEDVLEDGQKVQYSGTASVLARPPNGLRAEVTNDRNQRLFLYDGRNFTLYAERLGYYATVPAPPTILQLADKLDETYDVSVPLEDLFRWGAPGWSADAIKSAKKIGPSNVAGVTCEHYIFRQADVDWQVWLQRGEYPLPRKLVITTRTDEARPQHTALMTWNLAPSFNEAAFVFQPPAGAQRVTLPGPAPAAANKPGGK